jgi:hypothetical protein
LDQTLSLHRFLHLGTRGHALYVGFDIRPFAEIDVHARRPAKDCEKVGVGDGEFVACQVLLAGKLLIEPVESFPEILL